MPRKNNNAHKPTKPRALQALPASSPAVPVRTDAEDKVWAALYAHPNSTTAELAEAAKVGRSTAGKVLAAWDKDGTVTRICGIAEGGRRAADRWTVNDAADTAIPEAETVDEPSNANEASTPADVLDEPGADTATTEEIPTEDTVSSVDCSPLEPVPDLPTQPDTGANNSSGKPPSAKAGRLGKGELRGMVEDFLTEHAGEQFSPNAIGKALNRSAGAVNNALEKLVADGYALKTQNSPKRFAAKLDEPGA
ncbi:MarR family transcriptional regulator [Saccharopolyspora phatthalungensis]|uniref:Putative transcriptional regulator n=1 Tax=Saccharopolyspora phatthalungensis TaxID=664693 RepID=A0A840QCC5_9PSEU|nr:MarR family transcriptional regulator [Saccharopolyspora phatthalungensis]MBB5157430.1 putative transcriptional regulator [Saccharopolyspora phatthalungensis]